MKTYKRNPEGNRQQELRCFEYSIEDLNNIFRKLLSDDEAWLPEEATFLACGVTYGQKRDEVGDIVDSEHLESEDAKVLLSDYLKKNVVAIVPEIEENADLTIRKYFVVFD